VERRLSNLLAPWLLSLRAGFFMEHFYGSLGSNQTTGNHGGGTRPDVPASMVPIDDIGAAGAEELQDA
jgi:hypothetical protein